MSELEEGAIGFVEDHAEADHADPETTRRDRIDGVHCDILEAPGKPARQLLSYSAE